MALREFDLSNIPMTDFTDTWEYTERLHRSGLASFPPAMVCCAITGANQGKEANPNLPETVDEQVRSSVEAVAAGAVMLHIHARDPKNTAVQAEYFEAFREVNAKIREKCPDVIINNNFGGNARVDPKTGIRGAQRMVSHLADPEVASLDIATYCSYVKLPARPGVRDEPEVRENITTITHTEAMRAAETLWARNIKPEFECFAMSDIYYLDRMIKDGYVDQNGAPHFLNFVFTGGSNWPTPEFIDTLVKATPHNTVLSITATGSQQWPVLAQALCHGTHVRVGMEDNVYYSKGRKAASNGELVEKIVQIATLLDRKVATCEEARKIMGLGAPRQYK